MSSSFALLYFSPKPFAFCCHITPNAPSKIIKSFLQIKDKGGFSVLNFLDFPDAFGIVDHSLLLRGIPYPVGCLFCSVLLYLSARSFIFQAVIFSAPNLTVGVPQGSHFEAYVLFVDINFCFSQHVFIHKDLSFNRFLFLKTSPCSS